MKAQDNKTKSGANAASINKLNAAKKIFTTLLLACKNLSIYPPAHSISVNSISQFHVQISSFLQQYGSLKFEIEREQVTTSDGPMAQGVPEQGSLHFALFQVGIRWLEFLPGIDPEETKGILLILDKYSKLSSEADGDIVTALWEAQFPHMRYEVAEFSWSDDQEEVSDISDLTGEKASDAPRKIHKRDETDTGDPFIDPAGLILTPQEAALLKTMVRQEEEPDQTSYLDILLDSLLQNREQESFKVILGVLSEEFTSSLARRDFIFTFKILYGLRQILDICKPETPWAGSFIEAFLLNASLPESHASLKEDWKQLDPEDAGILGQIFRFLTPQALETLVFLLPQPQPASLRQILMDSILFLASQDISSLESILNNSEEKVVEKLVPVIANIPGDQSLSCLISLARHPSAQIRHDAVKGLIRRDPGRVRDVFPLIHNMEDAVKILILDHMGRSRDYATEDLLLSYLQGLRFGNKELDYLLLCFKTLGKCGSTRSIPFLRENLFKGGLISGFRNAALRKGSALALATMNTPEAEKVLQEAGRSLYPSLRLVVSKTRRDLHPKGRR